VGSHTFRTPEFLGACCGLVDLLAVPQEIPFLCGVIAREIIYRVPRGLSGTRLQAVATLGDQSQRTTKAIALAGPNYARPRRVERIMSNTTSAPSPP
jgi:hypothetical protein